MLSEVLDAVTGHVVRLLERLPVEKSKKTGTHRYYLLRRRWVSVYIHHITRSDAQDVFHTHPFDAISFHLRHYMEETPCDPPKKRKLIHFIAGRRRHRVDLPDQKPILTLFIRGPRRWEWGYFNRDDTPVAMNPWRGPD